MTRLSCHRFRGNEVRLWLSILAYNLGNLWRRLALPAGIEDWSLTSLQQRLVKTGGRLVKHARYYWMMLAEGHLTRTRFAAMMRRIALLPLPANYRLAASSINQIHEEKEEGKVSEKSIRNAHYHASESKNGTESLSLSPQQRVSSCKPATSGTQF